MFSSNVICKCSALAVVVYSLLQPTRNSQCAEIRAVGSYGRFELSGEIASGDGQRFQRLVAETSNPNPILYVNSIGGDVVESFYIADTIRQHKMSVVLYWSDVCYSACFTLMAAARAIDTTAISRIGVHGAQSLSGRPLDSVTIAMIRAYHAMDVPPSILGKMAATPSSDITILDVDDLSKMQHISIEEVGARRIAESIAPPEKVNYDFSNEATAIRPYPFNCSNVVSAVPLPPPPPGSHWHYCKAEDLAAQDLYNRSPAGRHDAEIFARDQKRKSEIREQEIDAIVAHMPRPGSPDFWRWVEQHHFRSSRGD